MKLYLREGLRAIETAGDLADWCPCGEEEPRNLERPRSGVVVLEGGGIHDHPRRERGRQCPTINREISLKCNADQRNHLTGGRRLRINPLKRARTGVRDVVINRCALHATWELLHQRPNTPSPLGIPAVNKDHRVRGPVRWAEQHTVKCWDDLVHLWRNL
jgi:hypothetical protein